MKNHNTLPFQNKARNLIALYNRLENAKVLPVFLFSKKECAEHPQAIFQKIQQCDSDKIIIRSSSKNEDNEKNSNAGAFLSVGNINKTDEAQFFQALKKVCHSLPNDDDELLIQAFLENITACGVAFSVDKDTLAPYFCVQFDESGKNDSVTDGTGKNLRSFFAYRHHIQIEDCRMRQLIALIQELENLFGHPFLDIEFAFVHTQLYLFQVRPLVIQNKINLCNSLPAQALGRLYRRLDNLKEKRWGILGDDAIFGIMPDWNPAEIIGIRPKRLALSLYKEIVTDNIWAYQRDNYGYRDLKSHPLMHSFLGMPYIDVRVSFNSFIPKDLNQNIANKLVNYYCHRLINQPELHDKIEFFIVYSCYDLNSPQKLKQLLNYGFNENEIKRLEFALLNLTNNIINPENALFRKDILKSKKLNVAFEKIKNANYSLIDKIYWLLECCKRYGTLPFAGAARAGFVAMQMLNSLVEVGFLSLKQKEDFLNSLNTVSKKLSFQSAHLKAENLNSFLKEFGHLRAGTYNILSPRYDEAFEKYFNLDENKNENENKNKLKNKAFVLNPKQMQELDILLLENGLKINAHDFFQFLKEAIEGRESVKFEFSKLLSYAIDLIGQLGDYYGINKEEMAHLDIEHILSLYASLYSKNPKEMFLKAIQRYKKEYQLTQALKLPPVLISPKEVYSFFTQLILPNFITQKSVVADVALENESNLEGKIVLIQAADPGYDYLFSKNIAGLITCYGGANSHMAIRASELSLPSVIGVGEEKFAQLLNAKKLRIECANEQILCLSP